MKMSDADLAERINQICVRPGGLIELDAEQARLVACSVLVNTILATKWDLDLAIKSLAAVIALTIKEAPRLPRVRRN